MKIAAIIAEYNPFHEGHRYQIEETKKRTGADYILVLMSGNFVQRGEPAIFNKYERTRMALMGGADAVLELPSLYASASAEFFAGGAVSILNKLGVVDYLSFGSELGEISPFLTLSSYLVSHQEELDRKITLLLKDGLSYPVAREKALSQAGFEEECAPLLSSPNNILGVEYCKSLLSLNSSIQPFTLKREGMGYHEIDCGSFSGDRFPSASSMREKIKKGPEQQSFLTPDDFSTLLQYQLLMNKESGFQDYLDCTADLSSKIIKNYNKFESFTGYCNLLKSKDLTYTRISRVLLHILLNLKEYPASKDPFSSRQLPVEYVRLLGFRSGSSELLSEIKKHSSIPMISKLADAKNYLSPEGLSLLQKDIQISDLYEMVYAAKYKKGLLNEIQQSPIKLSNI